MWTTRIARGVCSSNYLVGVVSWGGLEIEGELPCGQQGLPGVYARVTDIRDWIDHHMSTYCS